MRITKDGWARTRRTTTDRAMALLRLPVLPFDKELE